MKKLGIISVLILFGSVLFIRAYQPAVSSETNAEYVYPEKIKTIIDDHCWGCHSEKGKSDKAKKALRWDQFDDLTKAKKVATLDNIIEVLENNEMPPEKFLEKYPNAKPSSKSVKALIKWANKEADKLMGE